MTEYTCNSWECASCLSLTEVCPKLVLILAARLCSVGRLCHASHAWTFNLKLMFDPSINVWIQVLISHVVVDDLTWECCKQRCLVDLASQELDSLSHRFVSTVFVFHLLLFGHYACLVLKIFNFSVFPPYAMWLNVISINLMQLSKRMLFTEWKNVWFTRYQLCTGDKVRHTGRPSTIQSVRVCQTRMATTCGGSSPTTLFQPPIWVIGRARLSSVGAPSNQLYRLDWLEKLHTGHPGIVRIVHCY